MPWFSRTPAHFRHTRDRMRNGRQNAVGDTRTQKSDDHAQPLRPLADGTQSGDDESRRETIIEKKQSVLIVVIYGFTTSG